MTIEIKGIDKLQKSLSAMSKQIPYASMLTLNDLAFDMQKALNAELKAGLKTRVNTSKAFAVDKATKSHLIATVHMKRDWHYLVLKHHYMGKTASQIAFERDMISRGYMTDSNSAIPIKKMGKAAYKKVSNATKKGIRSHSKLFVVPTTNRNKRTKHLEPGIYQRMKRKIKPIILFTKEAQYRKRFDMKITANKVFDRRASKYFFKNLDRAMRTAR